MRLTTRALTLILAVGIAAAGAFSGCTSGSPTAPGDDAVEVHYFLRTTPDSVMANLALAYDNEDLEPYLDCLAEALVFYPSDSAQAENEDIPEHWGKAEERQIHSDMWDEESFVSDVVLEMLQEGEPVELPGPSVEDPVMYEYLFDIDLTVMHPFDIAYVADAPSLFVLQIDPDEVGPAGQELWEILLWYDLDERPCGRPVLPTSWGEIKAMYLP